MEPPAMVHVIAHLELQPGTLEAFLAAFREVAEVVRAEPGCIAYVPTVDADTGIASQHRVGGEHVTVVEQWASVEALQAHDAAPHMQLFRARLRGLVTGRQIRMLTPV